MRVVLLVAVVSLGCVRPADRVVEVRDARCEAIAAEHEAACASALAVARAKNIHPDDERVELQATMLAWRDARMICGPRWTPYDQVRLETVREEVSALVARKERLGCARSLRYVYAAADAGDIEWAEVALADARQACGSRWDNRERIIAVEKLLTDLRRSVR